MHSNRSNLRTSSDRAYSQLVHAKKLLRSLGRVRLAENQDDETSSSQTSIESSCKLENGFRRSMSPEIVSLEANNEKPCDSGRTSPCKTNKDQLKADASYSCPEAGTSYSKFNHFETLNEKFQLDPSRLCHHIRSDYYQFAKIRRTEAEKLILEAKLRLEARCAQRESLEEQVRLRIRLEGIVLPDEEEEEADFIPLADDQTALVKRALARNDGDTLIEKFSIPIKKRDLITLAGSNWLNDEVINFYFNLIMERSGKNSLPRCYVFNTFFYTRLEQSGHSALKRWTKKIDLFSYDLILIPVHLGVHWCLATIDFRNQVVDYYDSLGGTNYQCTRLLLKYLQDERFDKKKESFDTSEWQERMLENIPNQMNGSDCGVFACKFADYSSRDAKINFTQAHMPYFRNRIMFEILNGQLL